MRKEIIKNAYAKVNLFLEITGRRADGYHEIDTVMQTVGLHDIVTVGYDPEGNGIALTCNKKYIPTDSGNIAYRCAELFLKETGLIGGVDIHIEKKIPVAAGLGGGSTDGAAVLKALNRLTEKKLSRKALSAMGAQLGADIPFCIRGGCARATGIGEIFTDAPTLKGYSGVISIGSHGSSTPAAYKALDEIGYLGTRSALPILAALESREGVEKELFNAFEEVIIPINPEVDEIKKMMLQNGAVASMMSGSGASVFGLFGSKSAAKTACNALRERGFFAVVSAVGQKEKAEHKL